MALTWKTQYPAMHNSPEGQLTAGISDTDLEIPVDYLEFYPEDEFLLVIDPANADWEYPETVRCEGIVSGSSGAGNLTALDRGFNALGDTGKARSWLISTRVIVTFTARHLTNIIDDLDYCKNPLSDQSIAITQLAEGKTFINDFSNDTSDNYTVTGTPVFGAGIVTLNTTEKLISVLNSLESSGCFGSVLKFTTTYSVDQSAKVYIGSTSYIDVQRKAADAVYLQLTVNGSELIASTDTTVTLADDTYGRIKVTYDGTNYQMYWNGVAVGSATAGNVMVTPSIGCLATASDVVVSELFHIPAISDSDDFATDTSANYAAVVGTTNYDDVNDNLDLITASGAGLKGQYRRRSYLNEEGGQKINVILPTGADGDYFNLVTHASSADMADGIGVGLQSDGAGNWNLTTLDGTTVTEGADSGLDDADVATIEIAKNIQGEYWYWIYDSAGVKPTTPTGKLFTTLARGYTGFYCNGAGGTTQTFTIDAFECRCNSIVGDTNCESEEAFFLRDDATVDGIAKYSQTGTWVFDTAHYDCGVTGNLIMLETVKEQTTEFSIAIPNGDTNYFYFEGYRLKAVQGASSCAITLETAAGVQVGSTTWTKIVDAGVHFVIEVLTTSTTATIKDGVGGASEISETITPDPIVPYWTGTNGTEVKLIQISGTRVYDTPMLRGTQIGLMNDGDEDIVCSAFSDDFERDNSADYDIVGTVIFDPTNKYCYANAQTDSIALKNLYEYGYFEFLISSSKVPSSNSYYYIFLNASYFLSISVASTGEVKIKLYNGGSIGRMVANYNHLNVKRVGISTTGSEIKCYDDGELYITYSKDIKLSTLKLSKVSGDMNHKLHIHKMSVNAFSLDSPNGISYSIPSVSHGGRYDTQESITLSITMDDVISGRISAMVRGAMALDATETKKFRVGIKNNTDDTAINLNDNLTTKYWDIDPTTELTEQYWGDLLTRFRDKDDTITLVISTDSGLPDSAFYTDTPYISPIHIRKEDD